MDPLTLRVAARVSSEEVLMYHGTTREALARILKEGLRPGQRLGGSQVVYFTDNYQEAALYSSTDNTQKKDRVVLTVRLPKGWLRRDPDFDFLCVHGRVPPECIVAVNKKPVTVKPDEPGPELIAQAMAAGEEAFRSGKPNVPAHDAVLHKILEANRDHPMGWTMPLLRAWGKGWMKANLAAPVE